MHIFHKQHLSISNVFFSRAAPSSYQKRILARKAHRNTSFHHDSCACDLQADIGLQMSFHIDHKLPHLDYLCEKMRCGCLDGFCVRMICHTSGILMSFLWSWYCAQGFDVSDIRPCSEILQHKGYRFF